MKKLIIATIALLACSCGGAQKENADEPSKLMYCENVWYNASADETGVLHLYGISLIDLVGDDEYISNNWVRLEINFGYKTTWNRFVLGNGSPDLLLLNRDYVE